MTTSSSINMQDMRHLNLFGRITRIQTRFCFWYNEHIVFCVPRALVSRAVGRGGENVKKICGILKKRVKVVSSPRGIEDAKSFIEAIVSPVTFQNLEIKSNEIVLTAGNQSKAALLGRNKRRFLEMQRIIKDYFGKEYRII